jgi:hypothetical protein
MTRHIMPRREKTKRWGLVLHRVIGQIQDLLARIGLAGDQQLGQMARHLAEVDDGLLILLGVVALPHHDEALVVVVVVGELLAGDSFTSSALSAANAGCMQATKAAAATAA